MWLFKFRFPEKKNFLSEYKVYQYIQMFLKVFGTTVTLLEILNLYFILNVGWCILILHFFIYLLI